MSKRESRGVLAVAIAGLLGGAAVVGVIYWTRGLEPNPAPNAQRSPAGDEIDDIRVKSNAKDPEEPRAPISEGGLSIVNEHLNLIKNPQSLQELREALKARWQKGIEPLRNRLAQIEAESPLSPERSLEACELYFKIGEMLIYTGQLEDAAASFKKALAIGRIPGMPARVRIQALGPLGIIAMRRGEVDNCIECVGPTSCIFPLAPEAVHTNTAGSREAIEHFTAYLQEVPNDLRIHWLLNLAHMTLGDYPEKVPAKFLVPLDTFRSKMDVAAFTNVAPRVGLTSRGPNLAGGSVFDDFTGDGLPDLFTTSLDLDRGASLFVNRGDGTFEDRSDAAGLGDQVYAINVTRADFDNDGDLDVLLLRGGWEAAMRMSLLRNNGKSGFEDVTLTAGLGEPIRTESAAWGDYDNDGFVDVFVCGEYQPESGADKSANQDPRNRCRLYRNQGNGTFADVAAAAGVVNERHAKGSGWGDYDGDGRLDLYVSNRFGAGRLYHQEKDGTFRDVGPELGVTGPDRGFACWFWDYDNDGRLDLYVNDYSAQFADVVAVAKGLAPKRPSRPRLYENAGTEGFREVGREVGLDKVMIPMGCNFGDIDNDGYLDFYQSTGLMFLEVLVPKMLFKNVAGERFEDVTMSSGTGHLQKGHGVSFADWDCDGDLDFFVELGGAVPGDNAYNVLFQNPGHGRHWLKVKLVGTKTNRAALGARIKAVIKDKDGAMRCVYRTVGNNSSFGGNSLVELIGLADATSVAQLEVSWPTSGRTQAFRDIPADQAIQITEGAEAYQVLRQPPLAVRTASATSR